MTEQMELMMIAKETERNSPSAAAAAAATANMSRKEKRKAAKKEKRKQKRKEVAEKDRQEFETLLNDPEEQRRIQFEEEKEKERLERERREFEERERIFLEELARRKAREEEEREEEEQRRAVLVEEQKLSEQQVGPDMEANEDEEWEYVEEGPPEIIWQGNEIIVKKNRVRVKKKSTIDQLVKEDENRPISNPLPPQFEAFADYKNASTMLSAQQLLENVAQQTPNFGTEQDKAHCPFHLKTGACRFGPRCSRVHFYPDKSCTLLIKNMYCGPGLVWEQDEGLEYTEEEVERSFEEFYEDVHTEFLKFGELVNFKVCRNGSHHLRGNVYVHYKSLESAMLAYHSINGRYFAGKQVNCEFVAVTKWKVAICGEYVRSNLKTCSRGSACNFIHCFRNPGGDYEWADWDKPPPRHWVEKMAALFGYSLQSECDKHKKETPRRFSDSIKRLTRDKERYHHRRSQSKEIESSNRSSSDPYEEDSVQRTKNWHATDDKGRELLDRRESREKTHCGHHHWPSKKRSYDSESDTEMFSRDRDADILRSSTRKRSRYHRKEFYDSRDTHSSGSHDETGSSKRKMERHGQEEHREKNTGEQEIMSGVVGNLEHKKRCDSTDSSRGQSCEDWDPASINDQRHRRLYDYDSTSESSDGVTERCHDYRRKSSRHLTEVSRISSDYTESHKISGNKSLGRESEQANCELFPVQKQSSSSRKNVEVVPLDGHKRSDEHLRRKSSRSDWRSESYDSDFSYGSSKMGFMKKQKKVLSEKSKQKFGSDDKLDYDHTEKDNRQDDANGYLDDDIDRRGRWESNQVDTEKQQKHRRKSHSRDYKHDIGCGSRDQSSDEYLRESRSRSSSKSSNKKHKTRSREMDSDAGLKEFDEGGGMINGRNYRSRGSKMHEKKTSS